MADAGCSGSSSANKWQALSEAPLCFLATNPNTLLSNCTPAMSTSRFHLKWKKKKNINKISYKHNAQEYN